MVMTDTVFKEKNNNFNNNMASVATKFQKNTNRNTQLDKETIAELIKAVLKEGFEKHQQKTS